MGTRKELLALQSLPLGVKIEKSKARIREWHDHWDGMVYVAFSGCNAYSISRPTSAPLSIWTEQDILRYASDNGLDLAPPYGEIAEDGDGKLHLTGDAGRTGCTLCGFGVHGEPQPNRYQRLAVSHPPIWKYGMEKLGIGAVCDYMGIPWKPIEIRKRNEDE